MPTFYDKVGLNKAQSQGKYSMANFLAEKFLSATEDALQDTSAGHDLQTDPMQFIAQSGLRSAIDIDIYKF